MKHLKDFRRIISYDFDGCLHLTVDKYGNPLGYFMSVDLLKPSISMIKQLKEDSKLSDIVIVTARNRGDEWYIQEFIDLWKLPVQHIFCTNDTSKLPILLKINAIKHYDDNPRVERDLLGSDIQFSYPSERVSFI